MAATTKERNTPQRGTEAKISDFQFDVAATTKINQGAMVALDAAGNAKGAITATGLRIPGRAQETVDNLTGAIGDKKVKVKRGVFRWGNSSAGDLITKADLFNDCYAVDDQTVAKTNGSSTRSVAGKIVDVDSSGVWVEHY
jgi:hypothetical protein